MHVLVYHQRPSEGAPCMRAFMISSQIGPVLFRYLAPQDKKPNGGDLYDGFLLIQ